MPGPTAAEKSWPVLRDPSRFSKDTPTNQVVRQASCAFFALRAFTPKRATSSHKRGGCYSCLKHKRGRQTARRLTRLGPSCPCPLLQTTQGLDGPVPLHRTSKLRRGSSRRSRSRSRALLYAISRSSNTDGANSCFEMVRTAINMLS